MTENVQQQAESQGPVFTTVITGLVLVLICVGIYTYFSKATGNIDISNVLKLVDVSAKKTDFSITLPKGDAFIFLMNKPETEFDFNGKCRIFDSGSMVSESVVNIFEINEKYIEQCNWLENETGKLAYILSWGTREILKANERYRIEITFDKLPPKGLAIWMSYVQKDKDHPKSDADKKIELQNMKIESSK